MCLSLLLLFLTMTSTTCMTLLYFSDSNIQPLTPDPDPSTPDPDPFTLDPDPCTQGPTSRDTSVRCPDTLHAVSVACRKRNIIPIKEKKRSRKPSPPRQKRPTSVQLLNEFLRKASCYASNCYHFFDRDHYLDKQDEANSLTREELDMVVLGQIQASLCVDDVVGLSHKHIPTQRKMTRVNTFFHLGKKICRGIFLTPHGIGKSSNK